MSKSKTYLRLFLGTAESYYDQIKAKLAEKWQSTNQPIHLMPYRGYATASYLYCRGRVLEDQGISTDESDGAWKNLKNTYKRFETDELPHVPLTLSFAQNTITATTNDEGYYFLQQKLDQPLPQHAIGWQPLYIQIANDNQLAPYSVRTVGEVIIPPPDAQYGIISDLDDTVIQTNVTSLLKMLYNTLFKNAHSRLPFNGVAPLYWALHRGKDDKHKNPLFYISNSPWNLYDMLVAFLRINQIPKGPILLRDFGNASKEETVVAYKKHKHLEIVRLLQTYPNLPFILIGDSGEKDAEIYRSIAQTFPGRVLAIYIRAVDDRKRAEAVEKIADAEENIDIILMEDSLKAAHHAYKHGFISKKGKLMVEEVMAAANPRFLDTYMLPDE